LFQVDAKATSEGATTPLHALFLKPPTGTNQRNVVRDFVYGCWCNGRRIGGMQMPPLNDLYAASHARQEGIEVAFLDAEMEADRYARLEADRFVDTLAVVVMSSTQSFRQDVRALERIKSLNPEVRSIVFGSHPTFMPNFCLKETAVDFIVLREAEATIRELLGALRDGTDTTSIQGLGYRAEDGSPVLTEARPLMDLDELTIPDRCLLPKDVTYFNPVVKRLPYTTMQTSRGCPARCIFCTAPTFYGNKYRFRSAENVLEELRQLQAAGYRQVIFRDETFTAHHRRTVEICEGMLREGMDLRWIANGRVDMVDVELMKLMKRAGCHMLKFGVETADDEMLKVYRKGTTCQQAEEALTRAHEVGLATHTHIIFGGPGETRETISNTMEFIRRMNPTTASFGIVTPYPGTELFDRVAQAKPDIGDGTASNMTNLHTLPFYADAMCTLPGEELSKAVTRAYRQFYFRPKYLLKRLLGFESFEEFMIQVVAGLNVSVFALTGRK
jgi:anaerobic magnesium-protoporphyrin IX monomethyl ester cyclase